MRGWARGERLPAVLRFVTFCDTFLPRYGAKFRGVSQRALTFKISETLENKGPPHFQGVRVRRIELLPQAWEAHVLPLNYTRASRDADLRANSTANQANSASGPQRDYFFAQTDRNRLLAGRVGGLIALESAGIA